MEKVGVKIKLLHPDAKIPVYATDGSAGFDIYAIENVSIKPNEVKMISTGLSYELPEGFHLQIWDRSGKAKQGIHHFAGVCDADYRGELKILLYNATKEPHHIEKGDRLVQAIVLPVYRAEFSLAKELSETKRGDGGFHSTGKK